ncbi:MAG: hypothetical protein MPK11_07970, partial [Gammaproteobacteria bacterium]|nr:hypothetical protein [Gammaproteobacteria bacterium]MDA7970689.1 hypothetical protein [Gammaproteobacteria bacterium]
SSSPNSRCGCRSCFTGGDATLSSVFFKYKPGCILKIFGKPVRKLRRAIAGKVSGPKILAEEANAD